MLRASEKVAVSLVAEVAGTVVGHVLFSPVSVHPPLGATPGVGLGPLAVLPGQRRRRIGASLVEVGLESCRRAGAAFAVVLGDPGYYARFGFRHARSAKLGNEYGADQEFMVRELQAGALASVSGIVRYAPEISTVGANPS